jgi:hypothetical protein
MRLEREGFACATDIVKPDNYSKTAGYNDITQNKDKTNVNHHTPNSNHKKLFASFGQRVHPKQPNPHCSTGFDLYFV